MKDVGLYVYITKWKVCEGYFFCSHHDASSSSLCVSYPQRNLILIWKVKCKEHKNVISDNIIITNVILE